MNNCDSKSSKFIEHSVHYVLWLQQDPGGGALCICEAFVYVQTGCEHAVAVCAPMFSVLEGDRWSGLFVEFPNRSNNFRYLL